MLLTANKTQVCIHATTAYLNVKRLVVLAHLVLHTVQIVIGEACNRESV